MGPAFYVMAILGCGEADTACQQVGLVESRYESLAECNAATADAVTRNVDLSFPVVAAQCRRADADIAEKLMPSEIDLPAPESVRDTKRIQRADLQARKKLRL